MDERDIVCVDNIDLHVYFSRHPLLVDKLLSSFPEKQFLCTTHSGTLIQHVKEKMGESSLYDIDEYRKKQVASASVQEKIEITPIVVKSSVIVGEEEND